jgi:hypothetical protein
MADTTPVRTEDVLPVRSRISWGAVFAGLFTALSVAVLLSVLGTALGLTWSEHTSRTDYVSSGAAIWSALTGLVALFAGGFVTSMFTTGENRAEAVLYGVILWGLMFACVAAISAAGTRLAFGTVLDTANVATNVSSADRERAVNDVRANIEANANRQNAARVAWWSLLGTVLSMAAAICGTLAGSGPQPILRGLFVRRTAVTVRAPGTTLPPR